jgi:hypothetical protein
MKENDIKIKDLRDPRWQLWYGSREPELQLQNLAETLKPHLAQIKHQPQSNLQHPEPLACGKLSHNTLH